MPNLTTNIEQVKDEISQCLFFMQYQATSFPVEAAIGRVIELRTLQIHLANLEEATRKGSTC